MGNIEIVVEGTTDNRRLGVKDKETGKQLWAHPLKSYAVTSVPE